MYKRKALLNYMLLFVFSQLTPAQWVQTGSISGLPKNRLIRNLALIPGDSNTTRLLAGTSDGAFCSDASYANWTAIDSGLPKNVIVSVSAFAVDSIEPNQQKIIMSTNRGVFFSTNPPINWTSIISIPTNIVCFSVFPNGAGGTDIFAGAAGSKIFRSVDHGITWSASDSGIYECGDIVGIVKSNNCLFAASSHRIWKSINSGVSWSLADSGNFFTDPCNGIDSWFIALSAVSNGTNKIDLFAGRSLGSGIFLTTNNGATWTRADSGLTNTDVTSFALSGSTLFVGTYEGVFFTTNYGVNWILADTAGFPIGAVGSDVTCLALTKDNLFAGTSGQGIWRLPLSDVSVKKEHGSLNNKQNRAGISISQFSSNTLFFLPVKTGSIAIYDIHGRMVAREHVEDNIAFWRGDHAPGRYVAQVLVGEANIAKSFVIAR